MWNEHRSLVLSKICTLLFMIGLVALLVSAPWIVDWLQLYSFNARGVYTGLFYATIYVGAVPAALLLYNLYRLLHNIGCGMVFTADNVRRLRAISWFCIAGAGVALASAIYYLPWLFVAFAAGFVGLIVRVVKNVFAEAMEIKAENDYTI